MLKPVTFSEWMLCQDWERKSWGDQIDPIASNGEWNKQVAYAEKMGIRDWDQKSKSILDVGCGPVSMLLRCHNFSFAVGVEPLDYGPTVRARYKAHNILLLQQPAEEMAFPAKFDEVWMYNVLQHVRDPNVIMENIKRYAGHMIRIFEWLDFPPHEGHPHQLTEAFFVDSLQLTPTDYDIVQMNTPTLQGKAIAIQKAIE